MLEIGTAVLRSSLSILGEIVEFASMWVKRNSLALAANFVIWLNLRLAHIVKRETSSTLLPISNVVNSKTRATYRLACQIRYLRSALWAQRQLIYLFQLTPALAERRDLLGLVLRYKLQFSGALPHQNTEWAEIS